LVFADFGCALSLRTRDNISVRALETTRAANQAQDLLSIDDKILGRDRSKLTPPVLASVDRQHSYCSLLPATEGRKINA
jgi:hypothetical protein